MPSAAGCCEWLTSSAEAFCGTCVDCLGAATSGIRRGKAFWISALPEAVAISGFGASKFWSELWIWWPAAVIMGWCFGLPCVVSVGSWRIWFEFDSLLVWVSGCKLSTGRSTFWPDPAGWQWEFVVAGAVNDCLLFSARTFRCELLHSRDRWICVSVMFLQNSC